MALKLIYSKNKTLFATTLEKKILNKFLYKKFLVRSFLFNNSTVVVLDDSSSFFNISISNLKNCDSTKEKYLLGASFQAQDFVYTNALNITLRFKLLMAHNSLKNFSWADSFYFLFDKYNKNSQKVSMLLFGPIKGGFDCYSSGAFGFFPRSHSSIFLKNSNFLNCFSKLNFLINSEHFLRKFFLTRLLVYFGKVSIYPSSKKNNFSSVKKRKKKNFSSNLNVVFLCKPAVTDSIIV